MAKKGSPDSPGCVVAIIVFLVLSLGSFALGQSVDNSFSIAVVGATIISLIVHSTWRSSRVDQELVDSIELRKKEALDKNIFNLAIQVALQWGNAAEGRFSFVSDQLEISILVAEDKSTKMTIVVNGKLVFESSSNVEKGVSYGEPIIRIERQGEGLEVVKEYGSKDKLAIRVDSYIPGKWVRNLQRLKEKADAERIEKQKAKELRLAKEKAQTERHKFGL